MSDKLENSEASPNAGLTYYCIDTETTGLKPGWAEITQISIIRNSDRHQLSLYIRPEFPERASEEALRKTGRTQADLYRGDSKLKAITAIDNFLSQDGLTPAHRCIIGHNCNFDQRFVHALWEEHEKPFMADLWANTQALAREFAKKNGIPKPKLTLGASLQMLSIKAAPGEHEAVADARNAYLLWNKALDLGLDHLAVIKNIPHTI